MSQTLYHGLARGARALEEARLLCFWATVGLLLVPAMYLAAAYLGATALVVHLRGPGATRRGSKP